MFAASVEILMVGKTTGATLCSKIMNGRTSIKVLQFMGLSNSHSIAWVDEIRGLFGGLDMFAFDVLHTLNQGDLILEINDYAMGLFAGILQ